MRDGGGSHGELSEEGKAKISKANKGRVSSRKGVKLSDETKQKIRIANLGNKMSEESKIKNRIASTGRIKSEETRKRISESHKGVKQSPSHRENNRKSKLIYWDKKKRELNSFRLFDLN
jgi:hypothetical protein